MPEINYFSLIRISAIASKTVRNGQKRVAIEIRIEPESNFDDRIFKSYKFPGCVNLDAHSAAHPTPTRKFSLHLYPSGFLDDCLPWFSKLRSMGNIVLNLLWSND